MLLNESICLRCRLAAKVLKGLKLLQSNVHIDVTGCWSLCPGDLCCCGCHLVHALCVWFLCVAQVADLAEKHGALDDCLVEEGQDLAVYPQTFLAT